MYKEYLNKKFPPGYIKCNQYGYFYFEFILQRKINLPSTYLVSTKSGEFDKKGGLEDYLVIVKYKKLFYSKGKIKAIDILYSEGDFCFSSPKDKEIIKVEKFFKLHPAPVKVNRVEKQPFRDMHPYALYLLSGGHHRGPNTRNDIICVNASKFKYSNNSNEVCEKIPFRKNNMSGFTLEPDTDFVLGPFSPKSLFHYTIIRRFTTPGNYLVRCVYDNGKNMTQVCYLLVHKASHYYYDHYKNKFILKELLVCDGDLGSTPPLKKEISKVEKLIATGKISGPLF
ncbi:hypothetical protein P0136_03665 [Lentisphaerota bacterium ZTH]|nr:hypothetical protein JYG24_05210 [Lentisphaerota bacterium]WET07098.1 hypothetical protein P0136_03665 [Lentisphaerota bacterium ZTH]